MPAGLILAVVMMGVLAVVTGPVAAQDTAVAPVEAVAAAAAPVLKIDTGIRPGFSCPQRWSC